jgi:ribose 5-phosphate isomerase A
MTDSNPEERSSLKRLAAEQAVEFVQPGMIIGLGTGSTAIFATRRIAELHKAAKLKGITGFATSKAVWREAQLLGIPMMEDDMPRAIDLTIDGADEADPALNLIKGGGGALLREKIVAQASQRVIIVVDDSKLSPHLGTHFSLPVEVLAFGWRSQRRYLESLGAKVEVRKDSEAREFVTDSGNMILDCAFGAIENPVQLGADLSARAGIVEHGLFLGLATDLIVAGQSGIRHLKAVDSRK